MFLLLKKVLRQEVAIFLLGLQIVKECCREEDNQLISNLQ